MEFFQKCCALAVLLGMSSVAVAAPPVPQAKMCVFDPQGANGDAFRAGRDFRYEMLDEAGVDIDVKEIGRASCRERVSSPV